MISYGVYILICLIMHCADVVTGLIKGFVTGKPSSHTMAQGLGKKAALLTTEAVAFVLTWGQQYVDTGLDGEIPFVQAACIFIILMELLSVLENVNETSGGKLDWLLKYVKRNIKKDDKTE